MNSAENSKISKENYDIVKLEKQWLWYICASLLLSLMFVVSFICFHQAFTLINERSQINQKEKK